MKGSRNLLTSIFLSALIVVPITLYCIPYISELSSFLLGIIACMVFVSLAFILVFARNRSSTLNGLEGSEEVQIASKNVTRIEASVWILIAAFVVTGGMVSGFLVYKQFELFKSMEAHQRVCDAQQSELLESIRKSGLSSMMSNVLDKIDDELKNSPERVLSEGTISRITALSSYFAPDSFNYVEADSLQVINYSLERGQLLLILSHLNLDSTSFSKIKHKTSFARADLKGADLSGTDLSGANMMSANLRDADLTDANFKQADLKGANFWGSDLSRADLSGAAMNRADLRWAEMNDTDLKGAVLDGIKLTGAKLRNADLTGAIIRYADLSGALLNESNLSMTVMFATDLSAANLSGANLSGADLRACNLSDADLHDANLSDVLLRNTAVREEDWLLKLDVWRVKGSKEIQELSTVGTHYLGGGLYAITKPVE